MCWKNELSDLGYEVLRKYGAKKRHELSKETGYPTDGLSKHLLGVDEGTIGLVDSWVQ